MEVAGGLATLAIRPPTPPREHDFNPSGRITDTEPYLTNLIRRNLNTPDESPSSTIDYFNKSSERPLKRVDFLPGGSKLLTSSSKNIIAYGSGVRSLPPSKECKPSKSILKAPKESLLCDPASEPQDYKEQSFPRMLEDVVRELASPSRSFRLDAYQTLNGCLKAYEDLPDPQAMAEKMPLLTGFIRRDLCPVTAAGGIQDTQLTVQVLKLVTILLWTPKLADALPDDFRIFILDLSISVLADHNSSKTLVNHYMHLLTIQKFRPKIMNEDRANRLLNVLKDITGHVKGNGVVGQRLMIYRVLLGQATAMMTRRVEDWLDHLFAGMLSNIKEVRARALAFGYDASISLGTISQVSRSVLDIFNRQSPEGKKFLDVLVHRLNDMIKSKEEGSHVPQVWSVTILFLRSRRNQLEHWEHMRSWLVVIQKCFNSSDMAVKFQAHMSWNRLIFAISPTTSTGSSMMRMLRQPIMTQLDRKHDDKQSRQARQVACASYCALLYYAFRPLSSYDTVDRFWDEYVAPLLIKTDTAFACQVLVSLFGDTQQKIWTENKANELAPIKPDELPRLDPKWVRLRSGTVLKVLDALLQSADWQPLESGEAWVLQAWRAFTRALSDAASKEVKVSVESMSAVAHMMSSLKHFWNHCNTRQAVHEASRTKTLQRLAELVEIAVLNLGPIPFAEKRLVQSTGDLFEAADTPSSRSTRIKGVLASPIYHLIGMVSSAQYETDAVKCYNETVRELIQIALRPATSRRSKLKVLHEIGSLTTSADTVLHELKVSLWELIFELLPTALTLSRLDDGTAESPYQLGPDYRDILKLLELEVQNSTRKTENWVATFEKVTSQIRQEAGNGGLVISLIEPFADFLRRQLSPGSIEELLPRIIVLIQNATWVESRSDLERTQRALWGSSLVPLKSNAITPFEKLYVLIDEILQAAYPLSDGAACNKIFNLFEALDHFLVACPAWQSGIALNRLQKGIALWVQDAKGCMNRTGIESRATYSAVLQLWQLVTRMICSLPRFDSSLLSLLNVLLEAGLSSRHKAILNLGIETWNNTFGLAEDLDYPGTLRKILLHLSTIASLELPGFSMGNNDMEIDLSPIQFIESLEQAESLLQTSTSNAGKHQQRHNASDSRDSAAEANLQRHNHMSSTPKSEPRRQPEKSTPTPKARHDDSQIHFATIESSPPGPEGPESQYLTVRQREVKERQQQEAAAMFPDVRSSPRPKSRDKQAQPSRLDLSSKYISETRNLVDETVSPTLPPANDMTNTFLGSSPTPWSSGKRLIATGYNDGPPSSPPVVPKHIDIDLDGTHGPGPISQHGLDAQEQIFDQPESEIQRKPAVEVTSEAVDREAHLVEIEASGVSKISARELAGNIDGYNSDSCRDPAAGNSDQKSDSSSKIDWDAWDEDAVDVSGIGEDKKMNEADDMPSSPCQEDVLETSQHTVLTDQDDEVSLQIVNDMERALSQAAETSKAVSPSKKRKRVSPGSGISVKRRSTDAPFDSVQVVVERWTPAAEDEDMLECIVVASSTTPAPSTVSVKQEKYDATGSFTQHQTLDSLHEETEDSQRKRNSRKSVSEAFTGRRRGRPRRVVKEMIGDSEPNEAAEPCSANQEGSSLVSPMSIEDTFCADMSFQHGVAAYSATDVVAAQSPGINEEQDRAKTRGQQEMDTDDIPTSEQMIPPIVAAEQDSLIKAVEQEVPSSIAPLSSHPQSSPSASPTPTRVLAHPSPSKPAGDEQAPHPNTGTDIKQKLKLILEEVKNAAISPEEGRDIISTWMDLGRELQNAERRGVS